MQTLGEAIAQHGGADAEVIEGSALSELLTGSDAVDVLRPHDGHDSMQGRGGSDLFVLEPSPNGRFNTDIIWNFQPGPGGDVILLNADDPWDPTPVTKIEPEHFNDQRYWWDHPDTLLVQDTGNGAFVHHSWGGVLLYGVTVAQLTGLSQIPCAGHDDDQEGDIAWRDANSRSSPTSCSTSSWPGLTRRPRSTRTGSSTG